MKESELELLKQVARENTAKARQALEQKPRATGAENASYAKRLRSVNQLVEAYNTMRHADFCDVVAAAFLAGNFSAQDASHAMYLREWVRCGATVKTSFPEWMEGEGAGHILALNEQWLATGLRNTPFNEWLASEPLPMELVETSDARGTGDAWDKIARLYDPNDTFQLDAHLTSAYQPRLEQSLIASATIATGFTVGCIASSSRRPARMVFTPS